jgi:EmrB/QacA subfamily drug resistance transporter
VASPLFLQNLDTSIMATAVPSIANSLNTEVLHLNLAITSYLLSLAVFLPASSWFADRFGARNVFCVAIGLFSLGSALCGLATSLPQLVVFRVIQGMGGAMMVPVGRLLLLRHIPPAQMVAAMVWFTVPGAMARVAGPLLGGIIVTITSWRWIFLLNIPFCVLGIAMAMWIIPGQKEAPVRKRFDGAGFVLLSLGLVGLVGGLDTAGRDLVSRETTAVALIGGFLCILAYWRYSQRASEPVIDPGLVKFKAYRTSVLGGMPLRIALGASPFLLPLLMQLGFGLSPMTSGMLTMATALGALCVRAIMKQTIRRFSFRAILVGATFMTSVFYILYGVLFRPDTPHTLIFVVLLFGGLFNSLAMVTLNTLGYSDIPAERMSQATAFSSMLQQLSLSLGVASSAAILALTAHLHGHSPAALAAGDFWPAFLSIGIMTWISVRYFSQLSTEEGANLRETPSPRS